MDIRNMSYLERSWAYVYEDVFRENDFIFVVFGTALLQGVIFFGLCGFLLYVDMTGRPAWMLRFKTQPGANEPIDREKLKKAIKQANFNLTFVSFPYLIFLYFAHKYMGSSCRTEDLPTFGTVVKDYIGYLVIQEISFYYMHRLFHWGPLYRNFHKLHHEWTAPATGIVAINAHPVEHLFVNMTTFTLGPLLMASHRFTTFLWYSQSMLITIVHHSGYHLPLLTSPEFHDYHHLKYNVNYGSHGVLDRLHGTMYKFLDSTQIKRHQRYCHITPMAEMYPIDKKSTSTKAD